MRNELQEYYKNLNQEALIHLEGLGDEFDHDEAKKLRLCIKKLKAFYRFYAFLFRVKPENHEFFKSIKPFNDEVGLLRDYKEVQGVAQNIQNDSGIDLSDFISFIHWRSAALESDFSRYSYANNKHIFNSEEKVFKILKGFDENELTDELLTFIKKQLYFIQKKRKQIECEEDMHEIRAVVKDLRYYCWYLKNLNNERAEDMSLKFIKSPARAIGRWHDLVVFRDMWLAYLEFRSKEGYEPKNQKWIQQYLNLEIAARKNDMIEAVDAPHVNFLKYPELISRPLPAKEV